REKYVSNPLKAFSLVRRVTEDWTHLQVYTKRKPGQEALAAMKKLVDGKIKLRNLKSMMQRIARIEQIYDLKSVDVAQGRLLGQHFNKEFSLRDCLAIAKHKYGSGDYTRSAIWYHQAIQHKAEPNSRAYDEAIGKPASTLRRNFVMATLMHAARIRHPNDTHKALQAKVDAALQKMSSIQLEKHVQQQLARDVDEFVAEAHKLQPPVSDFERGCRGQFVRRANLHCRYNHSTHPFLRLAPFRMEEINHDPYIVMFHNVFYDSELAEMRSLAVDMSDGYSGNVTAKQAESLDVVAHIAWLVHKSPFLQRLNRRISHMTGLDVSEFKALQVANFGLGGYFEPHYDYMDGERVMAESIAGLGDRLASIIFYSSDVPQGGMTTFPEIQVAVTPQKGSSLFWYNLFDDGRQDSRTLHSVCPVIVGSRWS
ncbi:hypothetical protein KR093_011722, partial [Drosophila rubida]